MMLKKSSFLLASYTNACSQCPHTGLPLLSTPASLPFQQNRSRPKKQHWRPYATDHSDNSRSGDDLSWPEISLPSPYQILHLSPQDKYSKHRFYALVKMYHPDRSHHSAIHSHIHRLPGAVKMERYRLIVAANNILCDPDKRKAYDRTGAGWNGCIEHGIHPSRYNWSQPNTGTRWSGFDTNDSPFQNATWEDWERWYNRHEKQEPVYTSNGGFLTFVIVAMVLGAFGQAELISTHNDLLVQNLEKKHDEATKVLTERRKESKKIMDVDSRLRTFFGREEMRDPVTPGNSGNKADSRKLLPAPITSSDRQRNENGKISHNQK